jgi:phosphate transport system permease protein
MTTVDSRPGIGGPPDTPPRTTVPRREVRLAPQPRPLTMLRLGDVMSLVGAMVAAGATTALLWTEISPFSGLIGAVIVAWFLWVAYYAILISFDENRMTVRDRVVALVVWSVALLIVGALAWVVLYTFFKGEPALAHLNFYTQDGRRGGPESPLTQSGALHALVGTLIEVAIAMVIAVPFGLLAAVFMNEVPGRFSRFVRTVVDAMTAMPDILAGLFIYATLITAFGLGLSGTAAGIALGLTALPIVCRTSDVVLRLMPAGLTEASYALGAGQWRTVRLVTLPTVRSGLVTAVILGVARAIGETAPVLLTSVVSETLTFHPGGPMNSLPLMAYISVQEPQAVENARAYGAASMLLVLVVLLFTLARWIGGRGPGQLTNGQRRRRAAASRRDADRYIRHARAETRQASTIGQGTQPAWPAGPQAGPVQQ